ncbi:MAG TPA: hypothetical protein PK323_12890 [Bacteroidia bacterium]|nr:hypothetical protein [Bacteroidia bacterium]
MYICGMKMPVLNKDGSVNVEATFANSEKSRKKELERISKLPKEEREYITRAQKSLSDHINS